MTSAWQDTGGMAGVTAAGGGRRGGGSRPVFSVRIAEEDGQSVLWAAGDLDFTTVALLEDALSGSQTGPGQTVTVDVSRLGFIDAGSVRLLMTADQRLRGGGSAGLRVRGAAGVVRRMLEIMQFASVRLLSLPLH
jgi:anti-anti-sigma factor